MTEINLALLGFGNVGRSFARYLMTEGACPGIKLRIKAIADKSGGVLVDAPEMVERLLAHKESGRSVREFAPAHSAVEIVEYIRMLPSVGISVLVESLPTNLTDGQPALDLIRSALVHRTSVVTVDKGPLIHGFEVLKESANAAGSQLACSGATGVRPPDELKGERVLEIRGILNGTTNYILTQMRERSLSFEHALRIAQSEGIAEPDPSLDIEGWDTASKLLILAKTLMGASSRLDDVSRIGIGPQTERLIETARASDRVVRLVGRARIWQGRVRISVAPKLIGPGSPFYSVAGASKAAIFRTENKGEILSFARSGRDSISRIILDDIRRIVKPPFLVS